MKVKTSELTGADLDWAVAKAVGQGVKILPFDNEAGQWQIRKSGILDVPYWPSYDWDQCGPLISKFHVYVFPGDRINKASISHPLRNGSICGCGETPQIAICRAIVAARLGDEIELPAELFRQEPEKP